MKYTNNKHRSVRTAIRIWNIQKTARGNWSYFGLVQILTIYSRMVLNAKVIATQAPLSLCTGSSPCYSS